MNRQLLVRNSKVVLFLVTALLLMLIAGCQDKAEQQAGKPATTSDGEVNLAGTLVTRIPQNSYGFLRWNGNHPAYEKLLQSPWANSDISKLMEGAGQDAQDTLNMLKKVGLDPMESATWRKMFSEAVFFVAPSSVAGAATPSAGTPPAGTPPAGTPSSGSPIYLGLVFQSTNISVQDKLQAIRTELKAAGQAVTDLEVDGGVGLKFIAKSKESSDETPLYFLAKGNLAVAATDEKGARQVLTTDGSQLPQLLASADFKKAFKGTPGEKVRFAMGFFDLAKLQADSKAKIVSSEALEAVNQEEFSALRAMSVSLAMEDAPRTDFRLVVDTTNASSAWLNNLAVSQSNNLVGSLPEKPLLFLSFDGQSLRKARDMASQGGEAMITSQLGFLDKVGRIGVVAGVAPAGQSILPIPDLMVLLESSDSEGSKTSIQQLIDLGLMTSPAMSGMQWADQKIDEETTIKSIMSPMGFGLFLGSKNNMVVLASSSAQIKSALGTAAKGKFAERLAPAANAVLTKEASVGNLYLNFEQLASLLENMGGLLAMYAPQNQDMGALLEPQKLQSLKEMGTMVGSITWGDGVIGVQSFYASAGGQAA